MGKLNLHEVEKHLSARNLTIFTSNELAEEFEVKIRTAQSFLEYNVKKNTIIRLKAGLFTLSSHPANDYEIANRLYFPSYISLETALSFHHLIPETIYSVTSITSKATRQFELLNRIFSYNKVKVSVFTGYDLVSTNGTTAYLASPEKAVVDFLYFVFLGKKMYNDRLDWSKINMTKLGVYLKLFSHKKFAKFVRKIQKTYDRQK